jgi:hypothetical protein
MPQSLFLHARDRVIAVELREESRRQRRASVCAPEMGVFYRGSRPIRPTAVRCPRSAWRRQVKARTSIIGPRNH